MMRDYKPDDGQGGGDGIVLARIGDACWLLEGEAHLDAMLTTTDGYPTPVRCIPLASMEALGALLPDGIETGALWAIHPAIVARLERDGQIVVTPLPDEG